MIIAGIDVETTGIDAENCEVIELGIWVCDSSTPEAAICSFSSMFRVKNWSEEAAAIHKIPKVLMESGISHNDINPYALFIEPYNVDYVIAHRAEFDKSFVIKYWSYFDKCKWLCSVKDLNHEYALSGKPKSYRLMHLAVDYSFIIDGWHKALTDARMVCMIASAHDLDKAWENKNIKKWTVKVWGPYNELHKEWLKDNNFFWSGENKVWHKSGIVFENLEPIIMSAAKPYNWEFSVEEMPPREY